LIFNCGFNPTRARVGSVLLWLPAAGGFPCAQLPISVGIECGQLTSSQSLVLLVKLLQLLLLSPLR